jgi:hypothetical protein
VTQADRHQTSSGLRERGSVLRCPTDVVDVEQCLVNGSTIWPLSQRHVWAPPAVDPTSLMFHLAWKQQPAKVTISRNDAAEVAISADHDASPGSNGVLTVTISPVSISRIARTDSTHPLGTQMGGAKPRTSISTTS